MILDEPLAYFITWSVYGSHLQGDERGWRKRGKGVQEPKPRLAQWRQEKLNHPILLLSVEQRLVVEHECRRHCNVRGWRSWALNVRSNHCHIVVTATGYSGSIVRDQLKANATRGLRDRFPVFRDRPAWSTGGDWKCINEIDGLDAVCCYVREAQDRMERNT